MNLLYTAKNYKYLWSHANIWHCLAWLELSSRLSHMAFYRLWIEFKPQYPVSWLITSRFQGFKGRVQPCSCPLQALVAKGLREVPGVQGARMQIHIQQIGPGMVQQIQTVHRVQGPGGAHQPQGPRKLQRAKVVREKEDYRGACGERWERPHEHPRLAECLRCWVWSTQVRHQERSHSTAGV